MKRSLFDTNPYHQAQAVREWQPPPLPLIASKGITEIRLNVETTGLKWFDGDRPVGLAVDYPIDGGFRSDYLPVGHASQNLDPALVKRWASVELKGVKLRNTNIRFDIHTLREWGVDLEALGCTASDVQHTAALLDDHRQKNNLDVLIQDFLGEVPMPRLDESRMAAYPAGLVAPRACYNVEAVRRLWDVMRPQIEAEDLGRVHDLEDKVIWVVCEMEKNGTPLDLDLLKQWEVRSRLQIESLQKELAAMTGRNLGNDLFGDMTGALNPDSPKEMEALFDALKLPVARTATGRPSFTAEVLSGIDHPAIRIIEKISRLIDLRAKYIVGDLKRVGSDGILRFALHQLRATKDDSTDAGEAGTVTGRFSSTQIVEGVGVNIQQRIKVAKQRIAWGYSEDDATHDDEIYLIRQLHVPASGEWLAADAMQIEYRLFANEVNSPRINAIFEKDPLASFHKETHKIFKEKIPDLPYRRMKDVNFAKIYAAGPKKIALMLGFITKAQFEDLNDKKARNTHPLLKETMQLLQVYDEMIPEAGPLIQRASRLAKERGYIKDILGRRCRFPNGWRLHKALNSRIQPSAATIMKMKLVELHAAREYTQLLLRFTVHDEVDGDARQPETKARVAEVLNAQSFPLRIPILWDVSTGKNWAEAA